MKASDLFCAGSENDFLEVLWEDTERRHCNAQGDKHVGTQESNISCGGVKP
jgi:hypothetical protein